MIRLTITHEDEQDSQRTSSKLVQPRQLQTLIAGLGEIDARVDEVEPNDSFFHIDAGLDKGGFKHEMRTKEECLKLIEDALPHENAEAVFNTALDAKFEKGFTSITIETVTHENSFKEALLKSEVARIDGALYTIHDDGHFSREDNGDHYTITPSENPNILEAGPNTWLLTGETGARHLIRFVGEEDESQDEDTLANILIDILQKRGMAGVRQSLRAACVHFASEAEGRENADAGPNPGILADLAEAIQTPAFLQEGYEGPVKTIDARKTPVAFVRKDGCMIDQLTVIEFIHKPSLKTSDEVMAAFQAGVNAWVENTEEGKKAWEDSCGDLNIGDLDGYSGDEGLNKALAKAGIYNWSGLFSLGDANEVSYDRVLADPAEAEA